MAKPVWAVALPVILITTSVLGTRMGRKEAVEADMSRSKLDRAQAMYSHSRS